MTEDEISRLDLTKKEMSDSQKQLAFEEHWNKIAAGVLFPVYSTLVGSFD